MDDIKYSNFIVAGIASVGATIFTNPLEVIKTRLQLQGELEKLGTYKINYKGTFHGIVQVAKHDGIVGLQKGLAPALGFQFILNSLRLGIYDTAVSCGLTKDKYGNQSVFYSFLAGGIGGSIGSCAGSPFFLVKTQLQSFTKSAIAVGHQREHTGMINAFRKIYSAHGIPGLYRGVIGNVPRAMLGSGAQLATFGPTKDFLKRHDILQKNSALNSFVCGLLAGSVMSIVITPPDIVLTRLYNQPLDVHGKGMLYRGVIDCFWKVFRAEGIHGLYKGFWPFYLRIAPHSMFVLVFYDELKLLRDKYYLRE